MTTYTITEFKAKAGEIIANLEDGNEVIITRGGKPCAKLTSVTESLEPTQKKRSLAELRGAYADPDTPDLEFDELQAIIRECWKNFGELPEDDDGI